MTTVPISRWGRPCRRSAFPGKTRAAWLRCLRVSERLAYASHSITWSVVGIDAFLASPLDVFAEYPDRRLGLLAMPTTDRAHR